MFGFVKRRIDVLENMNPARIYVENVRAFLGSNKKFAAWLCDKAVRDGYLTRWYAFEHPELHHTLLECPSEEEIDESKTVTDSIAENLGYSGEYRLADLKKVEFFKKG